MGGMGDGAGDLFGRESFPVKVDYLGARCLFRV